MNLLPRWKTVLGLFVVFAAGVFIGGAGMAGFIRREYVKRLDPETWTPRTMAWLREAAELTPSQENEIRPLVDAAIAEMVRLRDGTESKRQAVIKDLLVAVALKLPSDQREKLTAAAKSAAAKPSAWSVPQSETSRP